MLPLLKQLYFSFPFVSLPSLSLLTSPPAPILPPPVSCIKTIPEDNEPIVYNCTFSMEDLNTPPPSKRSQKWIFKISSFWRKNDGVDIYGSNKNMTDLYNQYMKDPRYVAFPMIAASLSSLPLSTHSYAVLRSVDMVYIHVPGSYTTMDIICMHLFKDKCYYCKPKPQWILDSGTSMHFSPKRDDFVEYTVFPKKDHILVHTATSNIYVIGIGKCIVLRCKNSNSTGARGIMRVWWETHQTIE